MYAIQSWSRCAFLTVAMVIATDCGVLADENVVRIGVIQPMSGNWSGYAQEGQPAFEYIIKKINDEGGIKSMGGAKIQLFFADDGSQPARTAAEARRLITEEKVQLLTGTLLSAEALAVSPVIDEFKTPTLSIWSAEVKAQYMYSIGYPLDRSYSQTMADFLEYLAKQKGFPIKNVAMVYSNYEAGQQTNKILLQKVKAMGFNIVGEIPLDTKAQDQTAAVLRIRSLKPDATVGLVTPRDGTLLHQARYSLNYFDCVFIGGTGGFSDPILWKDLGREIGGVALTRDLFGMTGFSANANIPAVQNIVKELRERGGLKMQVGQAAIQGAQGARVIQQVLEFAGSTDPQRMMEAFQKVNIPFGSPDLYLLKPKGLTFADDHMIADGTAAVIQWLPDQSQQIVYPPQFATAEPRSAK